MWNKVLSFFCAAVSLIIPRVYRYIEIHIRSLLYIGTHKTYKGISDLQTCGLHCIMEEKNAKNKEEKK